MIISHQHRFIFAAVPKTGTHALRRALRAHLGPDDEEQVALHGNSRLTDPDLARIEHGHVPLALLRERMGTARFEAYFRFGFVRNPHDRFVSYCAFMTRRGGEFLRDPQGVMRHVLFTLKPMQHVHFQPQWTQLADADGKLLTSVVGHVETMQADYDAICATLGLPGTPLQRVNASDHGDWRSYYDAELREAVQVLYARDFELFGYARDD